MFRGVTDLTLDAKGRLAVPARYRDRIVAQCQGQLVVTVDTDHCLLIYPLPEWEQVETKLARLPTLQARSRQLQRLLLGHATEVEMDAAGRLLVPPPLRAFAGLEREVVLIGQANKFELWDAARWQQKRESWLGEGADAAPLTAELESLSY